MGNTTVEHIAGNMYTTIDTVDQPSTNFDAVVLINTRLLAVAVLNLHEGRYYVSYCQQYMPSVYIPAPGNRPLANDELLHEVIRYHKFY